MIFANPFFYLLQIGTTGALVGLAFFLIFAAVAFVAYKMLKKTVKMAVRMTIVVAILLVALIGSVALLYFGTGDGKPASRTTPTAPKK